MKKPPPMNIIIRGLDRMVLCFRCEDEEIVVCIRYRLLLC